MPSQKRKSHGERDVSPYVSSDVRKNKKIRSNQNGITEDHITTHENVTLPMCKIDGTFDSEAIFKKSHRRKLGNDKKRKTGKAGALHDSIGCVWNGIEKANLKHSSDEGNLGAKKLRGKNGEINRGAGQGDVSNFISVQSPEFNGVKEETPHTFEGNYNNENEVLSKVKKKQRRKNKIIQSESYCIIQGDTPLGFERMKLMKDEVEDIDNTMFLKENEICGRITNEMQVKEKKRGVELEKEKTTQGEKKIKKIKMLSNMENEDVSDECAKDGVFNYINIVEEQNVRVANESDECEQENSSGIEQKKSKKKKPKSKRDSTENISKTDDVLADCAGKIDTENEENGVQGERKEKKLRKEKKASKKKRKKLSLDGGSESEKVIECEQVLEEISVRSQNEISEERVKNDVLTDCAGKIDTENEENGVQDEKKLRKEKKASKKKRKKLSLDGGSESEKVIECEQVLEEISVSSQNEISEERVKNDVLADCAGKIDIENEGNGVQDEEKLRKEKKASKKKRKKLSLDGGSESEKGIECEQVLEEISVSSQNEISEECVKNDVLTDCAGKIDIENEGNGVQDERKDKKASKKKRKKLSLERGSESENGEQVSEEISVRNLNETSEELVKNEEHNTQVDVKFSDPEGLDEDSSGKIKKKRKKELERKEKQGKEMPSTANIECDTFGEEEAGIVGNTSEQNNDDEAIGRIKKKVVKLSIESDEEEDSEKVKEKASSEVVVNGDMSKYEWFEEDSEEEEDNDFIVDDNYVSYDENATSDEDIPETECSSDDDSGSDQEDSCEVEEDEIEEEEEQQSLPKRKKIMASQFFDLEAEEGEETDIDDEEEEEESNEEDSEDDDSVVGVEQFIDSEAREEITFVKRKKKVQVIESEEEEEKEKEEKKYPEAESLEKTMHIMKKLTRLMTAGVLKGKARKQKRIINKEIENIEQDSEKRISMNESSDFTLRAVKERKRIILDGKSANQKTEELRIQQKVDDEIREILGEDKLGKKKRRKSATAWERGYASEPEYVEAKQQRV